MVDTPGAYQVDRLLKFIFWLTTVVFVLMRTFSIYFIAKRPERKVVKEVYRHVNNALEIIWTTIAGGHLHLAGGVQR